MDTDADTAASLAYALREEASRWPDHELRSRMAALRTRKSAQQFSTADLAECLALGAEAARRSAGIEADVSVLAAAGEVASGRVAEVREADDRRLACLLAAVVYALDGPGVHIVCVDDAEAARQAERAAAILGSAGISFGLIGPPKPWSREPRRTAYQADVTFASMASLMHDYLADGLATVSSELVHTALRVAILDDIIGLGVVRFRTVQYISAPFPSIAADLETVMGFTARLRRRSDVAIDADTGEAVLTESGFRSAEKKFGREALFQAESPAFLGRIHTALRSSKKVPEPKDTSMMLARIDLVDYLRQYQRVVGAAAELRPHRRDLKVLFGIEPPAGPEAAARQTSGRIDHRDLAFQEVEAGHRVRAWEHRRPILLGCDDNWRLGPELGATGPEAPRTRAAYQRREQELGPEILRELERRVRLSMQDFAWRRFLEELDMCMLYLGYLPPVRAVLDGYFERYRLFAAERFEAAERSALAESRRYILTVDVTMKT